MLQSYGYARLSSYTTPENYFNFRKGETNHIQEVILCYEPEVFYEFTPDSKLSLLCGASVFKGNYTGYTKDFAIIHLELRYRHNLTFEKFSIPLQISYVINPYSKRSWLDAGVGIEF